MPWDGDGRVMLAGKTTMMTVKMAILRVRQSGNCDFQDIYSREIEEINKFTFFSGGRGRCSKKTNLILNISFGHNLILSLQNFDHTIFYISSSIFQSLSVCEFMRER